MDTQTLHLQPPGLEELAAVLRPALSANYDTAAVDVVNCPDLREAPFHLTTEGLSGEECIGDVGGQPNLFPKPRHEITFSIPSLANAMQMGKDRGSLIGAGDGPYHVDHSNSELFTDFSWQDTVVRNGNYGAAVDPSTGAVHGRASTSDECSLMINLFGSTGTPGPVLKITARRRKGEQKSFPECIRQAILTAYGSAQPVSLGGAFLIKSGRTHWHIMPEFPAESNLPFKSFRQLNEWLTYHDFDSPIVCLSVLHSADPGQKLGLRMEHTHGYGKRAAGGGVGGHYHGDIEGEEVEYEAYFNTARTIYRIARPEKSLESDLHG